MIVMRMVMMILMLVMIYDGDETMLLLITTMAVSQAEIPLVMQLRMVDAESAIMHGLLDSHDKVEEEARTSARIVTALAGLSKGSKTDRSARAYWILQAAPDHIGAVQRRFRQKDLVLECERHSTARGRGHIKASQASYTMHWNV